MGDVERNDATRFCLGEWPCEASTAAASLERERNDLRAAGQRLAEALRWCGGSSDFAIGSFAGDGWQRTVEFALAAWDAVEKP